MIRLHLHLLSDSTGETLENIAKAGLAQFDGVETIGLPVRTSVLDGLAHNIDDRGIKAAIDLIKSVTAA